jgi:hypothetical protein
VTTATASPSSPAHYDYARRLILSFIAPSLLIVRARFDDPATAAGKILNFGQKLVNESAYQNRWATTRI